MVSDAPLSAAFAGPAVSGQSFSGQVASFTDANPFGSLADFTASIDWGDSSQLAGAIVPAGGGYSVSGSHSYASTGPFTITTTIHDVGGSSASNAFVTTAAGTAGTVTFWGAQWWKENILSGGSAPASFKGFAQASGAPMCGMNWTAAPGNSSNPPQPPFPDYMAVIVSSTITKSGSTISGDTEHVIIVKTNPGYASDPGSAGTGTVAAVIC